MHAAASFRPVVTLLLVAGVAAGTCAQELVLTEQDNGQTVGAVVSQSILVNLRGNPSTGFTWLLTSTNGDSVVPTGPAAYTPDAGGGPGSPGTFSFPFRAVHSGATTLTLDYLKSWEPTNVTQTFSATIEVSADTSGPRLSIALAETNVVITWPQAGSSGFYLEGTQSLSPPSWAALNVLPLPVGPDYQVTLAASGEALFFRLRK
jgi:inhibitor of cysteine peptidase